MLTVTIRDLVYRIFFKKKYRSEKKILLGPFDHSEITYLFSAFRCALAADKARLEMSRSKFLDCGEMVSLSGLAKATLEDNHPCARMVPLRILDEDTELPEMKGPNTYR